MLNRLVWYVRQARSLPAGVVLRKAGKVLAQEAAGLLARQAHRWRPTYGPPLAPGAELHRYLGAPPQAALRRSQDWVRGVSACYLAHRFDLLGSGWLQVRHGMDCPGVEGHRYAGGPPVAADARGEWLAPRINRANRPRAMALWALVDEGYVPIDWQLDFKSGYRWSEGRWLLDITFGDRPGSDIKVPWELARMQHLPQLAWAYALAAGGAGGFEAPERYAREFRNQVLDFAACNPPSFGVNWRCTMDVAIRVANWLVAYDAFRAAGAVFDGPFRAALLASVHAHGRFIVRHLEYDPHLRGNHYLANIVGLLFVAAYLPGAPAVDAWLAFAVQALTDEVPRQFHPDGSNAEASTCYHRLSAELALYGTALVLGLPAEKCAALHAAPRRRHLPWRPRLRSGAPPEHPLPDGRRVPFSADYRSRLERMGDFTADVTKPRGFVHQVGDNDSGRFLKLEPAFRLLTAGAARERCANLANSDAISDDAPYWMELHLDHAHLGAALSGLRERTAAAGPHADSLDAAVVRAYCAGRGLLPAAERAERASVRVKIGDEALWERLCAPLAALPAAQRQSARIPVETRRLAALRPFAYPDFGVYGWRSAEAYVAVRCGPIGQWGQGGHAHNDALALELTVGERDLIADPGSYLYTALPEWRHAYRSVRAHSAPQVEAREPGRLDLGLFRLGDEARAECLYFGVRGFIGRHWGYGAPVWRVLALERDAIVVHDYLQPAPGDDPRLRLLAPRLSGPAGVPFSPGYGIVERAESAG